VIKHEANRTPAAVDAILARDRNLLARFLLGSTAVRVVEHAPCPAIVAKGKIEPIKAKGKRWRARWMAAKT
jgi:nucleotide-binding universal stress UspA family protein